MSRYRAESNDEPIANLLPCKHYLHNSCLTPWVKRANSCPICRANASTSSQGTISPLRPGFTRSVAHPTLSEAVLYLTGSIRRLGRVDHQDAFLDTDAMERARGITIFSKQAEFTLDGWQVTLT